MGTELVAMSKKELERLEVVRRVVEGRLTQAKAGEFIGLSERQVRRLCAAFEERGPAGLVSGKRGQRSNRRLPDDLRSHAIEIVRDRYADFGPTLACEKLLELHDLRVSKETLRAWLIGAGIWIPRHERAWTAHQPRHRRECLASSCRSMVASTPGSRTAVRAARFWSTSTTPPGGCWSCAS